MKVSECNTEIALCHHSSKWKIWRRPTTEGDSPARERRCEHLTEFLFPYPAEPRWQLWANPAQGKARWPFAWRVWRDLRPDAYDLGKRTFSRPVKRIFEQFGETSS